MVTESVNEPLLELDNCASPTFPKVLSERPDLLRNWAASAAPTFPVFAGSTCGDSVTSWMLVIYVAS